MESKHRRKYVILGTGRSGTAYVSKLLQCSGLDIGHETLGADGISSWYLTEDTPNKNSGSWGDLSLSNPVVAHQLRNPLKTIPSLMTINKDSWDFIKNSTITSTWDNRLLVRSMRHWLEWNQVAFRKAEYHWTLEGLQKEIRPFLAAALPELSLDVFNKNVQKVSQATNSSKTRALDLNRIFDTSPQVLFRRLRQAYTPLLLTTEKMHAADSVLAQDIDAFHTEFKASVRFHRGLYESKKLEAKSVTNELQPQLSSEGKSVAE